MGVGCGVVTTKGLGAGVGLGVEVVIATEGVGIATTSGVVVGVATTTGLGDGAVGVEVGVASATGGVSGAIGDGFAVRTKGAWVSGVVGRGLKKRIAPAIPSATRKRAPTIVQMSTLRFGRGAATGAGESWTADGSADADTELLVGRAGVATLSFSAFQNSWQVRYLPSRPTHASRRISLLA